MRRTGPRGSGQYERITWDQALDTVARHMLRIRETHGNAAILDASRTGSQSMLHGRVAAQRFLNMFGGCTDLWSNMSAEAEVFSVRITYGEKDYKSAGREPTDFINSKLILMWGWSPGDGTFGTGTMQYLKHAKKPVTLKEIKESHKFDDWLLVRQGRLSTMSAPEAFWNWLEKEGVF